MAEAARQFDTTSPHIIFEAVGCAKQGRPAREYCDQTLRRYAGKIEGSLRAEGSHRHIKLNQFEGWRWTRRQAMKGTPDRPPPDPDCHTNSFKFGKVKPNNRNQKSMIIKIMIIFNKIDTFYLNSDIFRNEHSQET